MRALDSEIKSDGAHPIRISTSRTTRDSSRSSKVTAMPSRKSAIWTCRWVSESDAEEQDDEEKERGRGKQKWVDCGERLGTGGRFLLDVGMWTAPDTVSKV
jgi:hypothetical protein